MEPQRSAFHPLPVESPCTEGLRFDDDDVVDPSSSHQTAVPASVRRSPQLFATAATIRRPHPERSSGKGADGGSNGRLPPTTSSLTPPDEALARIFSCSEGCSPPCRTAFVTSSLARSLRSSIQTRGMYAARAER